MPKKLVGIPEKCTGCHTCELACAIANFGEANIAKSRIKVHTNVNSSVTHTIKVCTQTGEAAKAIKNCSKEAITWNKEENKIEVNEDECPEAQEYLKECPADSVFKHEDVSYPLVCNLSLACVKWCPTGALKVKEVEK